MEDQVDSLSEKRVRNGAQNKSCISLIRVMLWTLVILMVIANEGSLEGEAKKIKLKDLKKLKKYALLLAGQRKILYAIPFPVPLPVFVKRQHIYTHVPIIPRYVQQPSHSSYYYPTAMAAAYGGHDPYGSISEPATQVAEHPASEKVAERNKQEHSSAEHESSGKSSSQVQSASAGKYLAQLASTLVGQGSLASLLGAADNSGSGGSHVTKKLLGGSQAKLMSPSAFVATLRGRPSGASSSSMALEQQELLAEGSSKPSSVKLGKYTASELAQMSSLRLPDYHPLPEQAPIQVAPSHAIHRIPSRGALHLKPGIHSPYSSPAYWAQPMQHSFMEPNQHLALPLESAAPQHLLEEPPQLEMAASEASQLATLKALVEAKQQQLQNLQVSQQVQPQHSVDELRAAESNLLALRAHQLGLASAHLRLLNY